MSAFSGGEKPKRGRPSEDQAVKHGHLVGKTISYLTVLEILSDKVNPSGCLLPCRCKCGNEKRVRRRQLERKSVKSCGCHKPEPRRTHLF